MDDFKDFGLSGIMGFLFNGWRRLERLILEMEIKN